MSVDAERPGESKPSSKPTALKPGQTVCNRRDEKGKLCAGPLKRRPDPKYRSKTELEGSTVVYRCGRCYAEYEGPPSGFLRDPAMSTFVMNVQPDVTPPEPKREAEKK
ncbi:MAG: hypothetical protein ABI882_23385 [Acidobacteriota bacterium]